MMAATPQRETLKQIKGRICNKRAPLKFLITAEVHSIIGQEDDQLQHQGDEASDSEDVVLAKVSPPG